MNVPRWTSAVDNATSARTANRNSVTDNSTSTQAPGNTWEQQSDQQDFSKLLSDLEGKVEVPEYEFVRTSGEELPLEDTLGDQTAHAANEGRAEESASELSEFEEQLPALDRQEDSGGKAGTEAGELSMSSDLTGLMTSTVESTVEAHGTTSSESKTATQNALPLNEAAARILEEMQMRAKTSEARRWQFTLPGLLDGNVVVTVEKLADQSWVVDLSTPDECSDEDKLSLEHKLSERLGDVTLSTSLL